MMDNNKETVNIVSNDCLRGKPYLDIDRVINEGLTGGSVKKRDTSTNAEDA